MTLGEKIQTFRIRMGLSQDQLAEKLGINGRHLSRYENDHLLPSTEVLQRMAHFFGVTTDYLLDTGQQGDPGIRDRELQQQMLMIDRLEESEKALMKRFIRALLLDGRIKEIVVDGSKEIVPPESTMKVIALTRRGRKPLKRASG